MEGAFASDRNQPRSSPCKRHWGHHNRTLERKYRNASRGPWAEQSSNNVVIPGASRAGSFPKQLRSEYKFVTHSWAVTVRKLTSSGHPAAASNNYRSRETKTCIVRSYTIVKLVSTQFTIRLKIIGQNANHGLGIVNGSLGFSAAMQNLERRSRLDFDSRKRQLRNIHRRIVVSQVLFLSNPRIIVN
jgi:hypothetical protein